ncbi:MAG: HEPN domain-containing protein [Deferrisomatales bacterium]|nr:HEPN domain-containing protein [Deferrisomatales bacterium]
MTREQLIDYWLASADEDLRASESLFQNGHDAWALFLGHLVIEKLLKAVYVKLVDENVPRVHDSRTWRAGPGLRLRATRKSCWRLSHG